MNAGTININADTALGTSGTNLNVTGSSTLQLAASIPAMARAMPISAGQTLTIDTNSFNLANSGVISGATGALTKISTGTLTLSGVNTYGGGTTMSAGTININADTALGTAGTNLNVTGSSTLQLAASIPTMARAMPISAGQTLTIDTNSFNLANSGVISGATGALTKISAGTLTLSGVNTYGGGDNNERRHDQHQCRYRTGHLRHKSERDRQLNASASGKYSYDGAGYADFR